MADGQKPLPLTPAQIQAALAEIEKLRADRIAAESDYEKQKAKEQTNAQPDNHPSAKTQAERDQEARDNSALRNQQREIDKIRSNNKDTIKHITEEHKAVKAYVTADKAYKDIGKIPALRVTPPQNPVAKAGVSNENVLKNPLAKKLETKHDKPILATGPGFGRRR